MEFRNIKFGSITDINAGGTTMSNASTLGELKKEVPAIDAMSIGMSALAKTSNGGSVKLNGDSAILPTEDFTLYFVLDKNNSGSNKVVAIIENYLETVYGK